MMRVDVSEIKTYRECHRKHEYSSRNRFHLTPIKPNDNLIFGTQFHEVLAMMYMGATLDQLLEWINREVTDTVHWKVMDTMTKGYYNGPYQKDKERYTVIDIEKSFNYPVGFKDLDVLGANKNLEYLRNEDGEYLRDGDGNWIAVDGDGEIHEPIYVCGSIDMIVIDRQTNKLCGFEHKTAKNFRPEVYNFVDEQPRVYSWALKKILEDYHAQGKLMTITETGPIYLNQVKKLSTKFDYERVACEYTDDDLNNFMKLFVRDMNRIAFYAGDPEDSLPTPGYMKCQMCDYADLCMHYGYAHVDKDELLQEFDGEFQVRDHDHLEEKASRHNDAT